jgi:tetratricopeptide (TPR) repeat protein
MPAKSRKQQIQEMLRDDPNDTFLHYALAMEYVSEGQDEEAVRRFEALFKVAPDYVPAYHQSGLLLVRLGRTTQAGDILRQGISMARQQGDQHAVEEMLGLLSSLEN